MKRRIGFDWALTVTKSGQMASRSPRNRDFSVSPPPWEAEEALEVKQGEDDQQQCLFLNYCGIGGDETEIKTLESEIRRLCDEETADDLRKPTTSEALPEEGGRERLKKHRREMAGRVWIPEIWGQEELLKDWIDCSAFDACLFPSGIGSARAALVEEGRRANSGGLRLENRC